ncbi:lytic transglycosylase F, partial [Vibrio sp. 10N.286.49.E1]
IDLIATGLTQNNNLTRAYRAAPAYYYVSQQVVYKKGQWRPRNLDQLIKFENDRQAEFTKTQAESEEAASSEALTPSLVVVKDSHFEPTLK